METRIKQGLTLHKSISEERANVFSFLLDHLSESSEMMMANFQLLWCSRGIKNILWTIVKYLARLMFFKCEMSLLPHTLVNDFVVIQNKNRVAEPEKSTHKWCAGNARKWHCYSLEQLIWNSYGHFLVLKFGRDMVSVCNFRMSRTVMCHVLQEETFRRTSLLQCFFTLPCQTRVWLLWQAANSRLYSCLCSCVHMLELERNSTAINSFFI